MADKTVWVLSNRQDDRAVLWEQDVAHPGGEAFIGGSAPAYVAKTPAIEGLLRSGLIVEIPEPPDGPKKPIPVESGARDFTLNQPGEAIQLGRPLDPDLVPEGAQAKVEKQQEAAPDEVAVPAGVVIPPAPTPERDTRRR